MNFARAQQLASQPHWWSEDCPIQWQYFYALLSAVEQRHYFHPDYLSVAFLTVRNGYGQEKTLEGEKLQQYRWLQDQYRQDNLWLEKEHDRWLRARQEVLAEIDQITHQVGGWEKSELAEHYRRLLLLARESCRWGFFIECVDIYTTQVLPTQMQTALPQLTPSEINELALTLATPPVVSFMEEFQLRKLLLIQSHREELLATPTFADLPAEDPLHSDLQLLAREFGFISVNYAGSPPLTVDDLLAQLRQEATRKNTAEVAAAVQALESKTDDIFLTQAEALSQFELPEALLEDFEILRQIGSWIDERKELMVRTSLAIRRLLQRAAELTEVPTEQLGWYTFEELLELLDDGAPLPATTPMARAELSVFATELLPGEEFATLTIFTGNEASALQRLLATDEAHELRGNVASAPDGATHFRGRVQVILDATGAQLQPGAVLVTSMTRPDFVPLLHQAGAIITDEGGLTCHAAVVSRELGVPCIIGTRQATTQLQTGDEVELNLTTGEITKISD